MRGVQYTRDVNRSSDAQLPEVVDAAVAIPGIVSAAVFIRAAGSALLSLGAAAGIQGDALRRLSEAAQNASHPIARSFATASASFDETPTAPGGPRLRSHLPLLIDRDGRIDCAGVLAVAHDAPLDDEARAALRGLAERAADGLQALSSPHHDKVPRDSTRPGEGA